MKIIKEIEISQKEIIKAFQEEYKYEIRDYINDYICNSDKAVALEVKLIELAKKLEVKERLDFDQKVQTEWTDTLDELILEVLDEAFRTNERFEE